MTRGQEWTCECGAHNAALWTYCEGCGTARPGGGRPPVRLVAPWEPPVYNAAPAAAEFVAAKLKEIYAILDRMGGAAIPIGACPGHPQGCGRSGKAWPSNTTPEEAR